MRIHRVGSWVLLASIAWGAAAAGPAHGESKQLFADDFESGLARWEISNPEAITIVDSGSPEHGRVGVYASGGFFARVVRERAE